MDILRTMFDFTCSLILWIIIIACFLLLAPFLFVVLTVRSTEAIIYYWKYDAVALRAEDNLWMMSTPENLQIISGVLQIDGAVNVTSFQDLIQRRMIDKVDARNSKLYPQVTKHFLVGFFNFYWAPDVHFDLTDHVYSLAEMPIQDERELQRLLGEHVSKPFQDDQSMSPWEFVLVPYVDKNSNRKTVILFRLSHVISDGSSLAYFLVNILSDERSQNGTMIKKFSQQQRTWLNMKGLWNLPLVYIHLFLHKKDKNALHSKSLSVHKKITWSCPISLSNIKTIKNRMNATVNDVIVGAFAKAIHEYLQSNSSGNDQRQTFSAVFAVDTRSSMKQAMYFRNHVAGVVLQLPKPTESEPCQIIKDTKNIFDYQKGIGAPISLYLGWRVVSLILPFCVSKYFVCNIVNKTTSSVSNLIGPLYPIYIGGSLVDFLTFWPPPTGKQSMGVSFCSYNDWVWMGVQSDCNSFPRPEELVTRFEQNVLALE